MTKPFQTFPEYKEGVKDMGSFPTGPQSLGEYLKEMTEVHFGKFLN